MTKNVIMQVEDLSFSYGITPILEKINISIYAGSIVTIIGPNGSGKTTLVKLILKLLKPKVGKIYIDPSITIGFMPQKIFISHLMPLTVNKFLQLAINYNLKSYSTEEIANIIGISHLLNKQIYNISGGELQKVMFACSLINKPQFLVLDEPVQGVDITGQVEFYTMIEQIRDLTHSTILMISHDLYMVMKSTDYVICLNKHICCEGTPESISKNSSYLSLFGENAINKVAIYQHSHDHKH